MLQTFRATLKGNSLEWGEGVQFLSGTDVKVQVLVTILEEETIPADSGRGKRMAAVLEKLAQAQAFANIDPVAWQREIRQDRELPDRGE
ncbi:MAG: hypothetical protein ACFCUV_23370 [Rivularia sp. (in: cyanobacteria)]